MSRSRQPALATWLLNRFGAGPRHESVVGDLSEQYVRGRSARWYWRQAVMCVIVGVVGEARAHVWLTGRALVLGWTSYWGLAGPANWLTQAARSRIQAWPWILGGDPSWAEFWAGKVCSTLIVGTACVLSGWIVARLHRSHAMAMVSLFAVSVFVFEYGMASWMFWRYALPGSAALMPRTTVVLPAVLMSTRPLGILIGGLSSSQTSRRSA